jgi:hopanoid-associated phosphorylase
MKWLAPWLFCTIAAHAQQNVLVISGMTTEQQIATGPNVVSVLSGGDPNVLIQALKNIDPSTIRAVISFGVAGGLDPKLVPGSVVVATSVIDENQTVFPVDASLVQEIEMDLQSQNITYQASSMAGVNVAILDQASKDAYFAKTGAQSVDMESHIAAEWAADNHLPFAVLRSISDPENLSVPAIASQALNPDGSINYSAVIGDIMKNPGDLQPLIQTSKDTQAAYAELKTCRAAADLGNL